MPDTPLEAARRAYAGARLELEDARRRGDTPAKESYVDAVLELLDALAAHDQPREILEVIAEVVRDEGDFAGVRSELAHRRARAGVALGDRAVVSSALRALRADAAKLRGSAKHEAERELAALEAELARAPTAPPVETAPARRWAHATFGEGVELGGDAQTVRLRFADGTERAILRTKLRAL